MKRKHGRYAEEVKQGLHDKKGGAGRVKGGGKAKAAAADAENGVPATKRRASKKPAKSKSSDAQTVAEERTLFNMDNDDDVDNVLSEVVDAEGEEPEGTEGDETETQRSVAASELETDDVMAAFRQATHGRGSMERDELLKNVATILGYQRLGAKIDETLRGHLRAAIRRRIIEADGATLVRAGTASMADFTLEELRDVFVSVMRKNTRYEREAVIHAVAKHLGFSRVPDNSREAIKSAINSGIRQDVLSYESSEIWREA